jgi:two-component system, NarL family, nitrate/nitrite response regulator NarL
MRQQQNIIKVLLVDDHPLLRRGLRETLTEQGDFQIVGEGATAEDAVMLSQTIDCDVIVLDVNMPGNGLSAVEKIARINKAPKIVMLSVFDNMANVRSAMENGASGYVLKGIEGDELARILRVVRDGKKHVEPELAAKLLSGNSDEVQVQSSRVPADVPGLALLTKREKQIFDLMSKGMSNRSIAKKLRLEEETVKHYNTQMFQKLGVRNRTEAALLAAGRV